MTYLPLSRLFCALLAAFLWMAGAVTAQEAPTWNASAGMMPIGEDPERPDAELFHVDYIKNGADPATRPVTFLVNGGPGGASIFLHIAAVGPLTIATPGDGTFPAVPATLEKNSDSWIDFTDLVFIDPVGTGYSRMLPGPDGQPGDPEKYYAVDSDMHTIAWFIRQWLTANDRWGSPKALAGESYGGQRVSGLSQILAQDYGINLNMAILISPALHTEIPDTRYSILRPITLFPTQAAIAAHYGLNGEPTGTEALEEFERFALNELASGLVRLGRSDQVSTKAFYDTVAGMIGLDPEYVARKRARIGDQDFATTILQNKGLMIDRYDGTIASENPIPELAGLNVMDRSLAVLTGVLLPPFMDYVRGELGYVTDRSYIPLSIAVNLAWDRSSKAGGPDDLALALTQNPDLRALVVHGMHDLATPYFLSKYVLEQSVVTPGARERLYFGVYPGGHMFYLQKASRAEFAADVRKFYEGAN
ncbi:S10 family peptidase [Rhodobacter ferrooxidans]|uniref:Peptidase S10 serine carboxypeptidase n=1 Tax=Rhodobacter ferrooxidans TaxID=371731 RepID=C8S425_9RHOB|nr:peptidase S10 [Rhodobacter sp. SW2]EEW24287.1 peptidase S10 serine carboxypeptidase [Rhodobacter sp. SW2]